MKVEYDGMKEFFKKCNAAGNGEFKRHLSMFLEGVGLNFLSVIQDEIIRRKVMDTRLLLASFHRGGDANIWKLNESNVTLEVGTNVEYARAVNDGHWTCKKGEAMRFVPGKWSGNRFIYDPSAKTGMMLKQKFIKGTHYWESGLKIIEKMLPELLDGKIQEWRDSYFG